ncbi:MAG TPA: Holliday junction branch migration protein RuvA [Minicystis sp.]|nr:Holliday junction branch migration protein RuvA [Minicystis sp.]
MIGRLSGRIVEEAPDGTLVLDVNGVGYEVMVPPGALGRAGLSRAPGDVTLHVHTHVREDALLLYGFPAAEDRAAFRMLIGVSNVGPKMALAVLGAMGAHELAAVVSRGHAQKLVAVPGIGKKTAERIVLELKDKLAELPAAAGGAQPASAARPADGKAELLFGALTRMGFRGAEAERAVATLGERVETDPLADLVRDALALLAR